MKKIALTFIFSSLLMFFPLSESAALEISVEITGPENLTALKPGLEKTITARCIAAGVDATLPQSLSSSITQLGDVISFDAALNSEPPKAFHKDLKGVGDLSATIDEMIKSLFPGTTISPLAEPSAFSLHPSAQYVLPIEATSIAIINGVILVSEKSIIYSTSDGILQPWWKAPEGDTIFRIYSYKGHIIALVSHHNRFHTYRISERSIVKKWKNPVIPMGEGLISAKLKIAPNLMGKVNRWTKVHAVEGSPVVPPEGVDVLATIIAEIDPFTETPDVISRDSEDTLMVQNTHGKVWKGTSSIIGPPLFIEKRGVIKIMNPTDEFSKTDIESYQYKLRYYLPPRIAVLDDKRIITFTNSANLLNGQDKALPEILSYTWGATGLAKNIIYNISEGYCADLTVEDKKLFALIANGGQSTLLTIELK